MMNKYTTYLSIAAALMMAVSCSQTNPEPIEPATVMESVSIVLDERTTAKVYTNSNSVRTLPMIVGESITFGYATEPEDLSTVTFPDVVWSSSDETVATVDEKGTVTAWTSGETNITLTTAAINMVAVATLHVEVVASDEIVRVTDIQISADNTMWEGEAETSNRRCYEGDVLNFSATLAPENTTYRNVLWSVDNEEAATIDAVTGVLTAGYIPEGQQFMEVVVTAVALDAENPFSASSKVQIIPSINPAGIRFTNAPTATDVFSLSQMSFTAEYEVYPELSTVSRIQWVSDNVEVATVEGGVVTFRKYGTATITAVCPGDENLGEGFRKEASFTIVIPAGYYDEVFHTSGYLWYLDTDHAAKGAKVEWTEADTESGVLENYLTVTPFLENGKARGDMKYNGMYLSGQYPVICLRVDDVADIDGKGFSRKINIDASDGKSVSGSATYGGNLKGDNGWLKKYSCSDDSSILVYNLIEQKFSKSDAVFTADEVARINRLTLKYADIATPESADQAAYRFFWFKTFANEESMIEFLDEWSARTGISYTEKR